MITNRLNDIFFFLSFCSVFLDIISILIVFCFNFLSILYRIYDLLYHLNDTKSRLNEIYLVMISILIFSCFNFYSDGVSRNIQTV